MFRLVLIKLSYKLSVLHLGNFSPELGDSLRALINRGFESFEKLVSLKEGLRMDADLPQLVDLSLKDLRVLLLLEKGLFKLNDVGWALLLLELHYEVLKLFNPE